MRDQAARLRSLARRLREAPRTGRPVSIVVAGGKGGVGRTVVALNLAVAYADLGLEVVLAEGPAVPAGLEVLTGAVHLPDALVLATGDAARPGMLPAAHPEGAGAGERNAGDIVVLDAGPGLSPAVIDAAARADVLLVVTSVEVTSIIGAYALLKEVVAAGGTPSMRCVVNGARSPREAEGAAAGLALAVSHFLRRTIDHAGTIPADPAVGASVAAQTPLLMHDSLSGAALSIRALADQLLRDVRVIAFGKVGMS